MGRSPRNPIRKRAREHGAGRQMLHGLTVHAFGGSSRWGTGVNWLPQEGFALQAHRSAPGGERPVIAVAQVRSSRH
jgi:hypothetical protein